MAKNFTYDRVRTTVTNRAGQQEDHHWITRTPPGGTAQVVAQTPYSTVAAAILEGLNLRNRFEADLLVRAVHAVRRERANDLTTIGPGDPVDTLCDAVERLLGADGADSGR